MRCFQWISHERYDIQNDEELSRSEYHYQLKRKWCNIIAMVENIIGDSHNIDTKHFIIDQLKQIRCYRLMVSKIPLVSDFYSHLLKIWNGFLNIAVTFNMENKGLVFPNCGSKIKGIG
jgi:hypothetical protein